MFVNREIMIELVLPAVLFIILSPGLLLDVDVSRVTKGLNKVVKFGGMKTSTGSVLTHAVVYYVLLDMVRKMLGKESTKPANVIVPTILFVILSPGMLLHVQPSKMKVAVMDGKTGQEGIITHAVVLASVYAILRRTFPEVY
jgi:hypothetical protein